MTVFAADTFDRANENLGVSAASDGGTWTKESFASGIPSIATNRLRSNSANVNIYRHSATPASADYSAEADIFINDDTLTTRIGPAVRVDTFGNCYNGYYLKPSNRFEIRKETGGTGSAQPTTTLIANSGDNSHTGTNGTTYVCEIVVAGNQVSLKVGGVQAIAPFTDTSLSAAERPGVRASVNNLGCLLSSWRAMETAASTDLVIQSGAHVHSAESSTLTQDHSLAVQDSSHVQTAENVAITISTALVVQDATHGHSAEPLALTGNHVLVVANSVHSHSADNVTLTQGHGLAVQDAVHAHTAQSLSITQSHQLAIAGATHSHTASEVLLVQAQNLNTESAVHSHFADGLTLVQVYVLEVSSSAHGHVAQNLDLVTPNVLAISNSFHSHTARNIPFIRPKSGSVFKVPEEDRSLTVGAEGNTFVVSKEERIFHT